MCKVAWFLFSSCCRERIPDDCWHVNITKIQQTRMLVTCQKFGDLFLFGLVWQYSSIQKNIVKVGSKSWILTCSCHITLSLPFYTDPASKRELNFSNGYLSLLYFCFRHSVSVSVFGLRPDVFSGQIFGFGLKWKTDFRSFTAVSNLGGQMENLKF